MRFTQWTSADTHKDWEAEVAEGILKKMGAQCVFKKNNVKYVCRLVSCWRTPEGMAEEPALVVEEGNEWYALSVGSGSYGSV